MTDLDLIQLRNFITESPASQPEREKLLASLDGLLTATAGQALLIRGLAMQLRNARIGSAQLASAMPTAALADVARALDRPATTAVSVEHAEAAARELARQTSSGASLAAILASIARIARVFV